MDYQSIKIVNISQSFFFFHFKHIPKFMQKTESIILSWMVYDYSLPFGRLGSFNKSLKLSTTVSFWNHINSGLLFLTVCIFEDYFSSIKLAEGRRLRLLLYSMFRLDPLYLYFPPLHEMASSCVFQAIPARQAVVYCLKETLGTIYFVLYRNRNDLCP